MTISSTNRVAGPFTGSGSAATFPFAFKVFEAGDLYVVLLEVATGTITVLALTTDYTAALNSNQDVSPGGSITLTAGNLASGYTLTMTTDIPELQGVALTNGGGFYPDVVDAEFDLLTILIQQLKDQVALALQYPATDVGLNAQLPPAAQRAGKFLYFDQNGNPSLLAAAPSGMALFAGGMVEEPDGARTVFTMTNSGSPIGATPVQVTVWDNYSLVQGKGFTLGPEPGQVTYTAAPAADDAVFAQGVMQL